MARPRKPTALKKAQGTLQKCRTNPNEWTPPVGAPPEPEGLGKIARAEWRRVVEHLVAAGVVAQVDQTTLEGYCRMYEQAKIYGEIAKADPMVETVMSGAKVNPAAEASRKAWALARQFATEFGMSPASRSRVSGGEKKEPDDSEEFLFGGGLKLVGGGKVPTGTA